MECLVVCHVGLGGRAKERERKNLVVGQDGHFIKLLITSIVPFYIIYPI
jgi:hypothetical protein